MSAVDLRTIIEFASGWAEQQFARGGVVLPMWHAVKSNGDHMILAAPQTDKDLAAALVRAAFELNDVVRCVFIDEAWTAKGGEELGKWLEQHGSVQTYPSRIEVVAFMGEDDTAGMMTAHRRIIRGQGKPKLGPLEFTDLSGVQSHGRLVGMLPRRTAKVQ